MDFFFKKLNVFASACPPTLFFRAKLTRTKRLNDCGLTERYFQTDHSTVDYVQQNIFDYQLYFSQIQYLKPSQVPGSCSYTCPFKKLWNVADWWQNLIKIPMFIQILSRTYKQDLFEILSAPSVQADIKIYPRHSTLTSKNSCQSLIARQFIIEIDFI